MHIYPSTFIYESKVLRESKSILKTNLFKEVHLVGIKDKNLSSKEYLDKNLKVIRVSYLYKGKNLFIKAFSFFIWNIRVIFLSIFKNISCISCHSLNCLPLALFLKIFNKSNIIYVPHELETERNGLNEISKQISRFTEKSLIKYVDHTLFISKSYQKWYSKKYKLTNTEVIYNCPYNSDFINSNILRKNFEIKDQKPIFIYQGIISDGRGIYNMVEAFKTLSDKANLVILGFGPLEQYVINESSKNKNIFPPPPVSSDVLLNYTSSADFGILLIESSSLSYELSMPNKLFEYVSALLPVIISPVKAQKNFVRENKIGISCNSLKKEDICNTVNKILDSDYDKFKFNLINCKKKYNWSNQEKKLIKSYRRVMLNN